jgi:hypothetical protein
MQKTSNDCWIKDFFEIVAKELGLFIISMERKVP